MTVRGRLIAAILAIAILLLIPAIYSALRLRDVNRIASDQLQQHAEAYVHVSNLGGSLSELESDLRLYAALLNDSMRAAVDTSMTTAREIADSLGEKGYRDPVLALNVRMDSVQAGVSRVDRMVADSMLSEATDSITYEVSPLLDGTRETLRTLRSEIDERSGADLERAQTMTSAAYLTTVLALIVCASLAVVLGLWTTRAVTSPVARLEAAMARVADGEFHVPADLPYDRPDEIGSASRSFRSMTHRLADLDRLRAELMSIATHELKTPINVIIGFAELMHQRVYGELNEKQADAIVTIHDQASVVTNLVNQLLDMSRLEAGGLPLRISEFDVRELIERASSALEALVAKKKIDFVVTIDDDAPATIRGDADRLADQVLGNLLSNAVKFTPAGGRITLSACSGDHTLEIEVADTGPGIPEDQLANIFDMFYQVGGGPRSEGAGLGLAIANEIVVGLGGRITASSDPGQGARFRIILPLGPDTDPVIEPGGPPGGHLTTHTSTADARPLPPDGSAPEDPPSSGTRAHPDDQRTGDPHASSLT